MQGIVELLFWAVAGLVVYTYAGYPVVLWILARARGNRTAEADPYTPRVTFIISAYNEEKDIGAKLRNVLALDYPRDRVQILVASDGSTDRTESIVKDFSSEGVELVACPRVGKEKAKVSAVERATGEILVFSDATSHWNPPALRRMAARFADPRVGCLSGRTVYGAETESPVSVGAGLYWDYEYYTKFFESRLGQLVVVCGTIHAIRKKLFREIPGECSADMVVPLGTLDQGSLSVYEPGATAREEHRHRSGEEIRNRARVVTRGLTNIWKFKRLLNPFYRPRVTFHLVSHKLLRWLIPEMLLVLLILNLFLLAEPFYRVLFAGQAAVYLAGLLGAFVPRTRIRLLIIPYYFCLINYCALVGFLRFSTGRKISTWETER